jgi:hypothetical protein
MSIVILCSAQGVDGPLGHPILKREGVELSVFNELPRAFLELKSKRVDLLILEEGGSVEETLALVRRVGDVTANVDIKIICLWKHAPPADLPESLALSLPFPPPADEFEKAITEALAVEARKARRVLLRMSLSMRAADQSFLCATVDVSRTGFLVECNRTLQVNANYDVRFMGLPGRPLPQFQARVVREKPRKAKLTLRYYACAFNGMPPEDVERLAEALDL